MASQELSGACHNKVISCPIGRLLRRELGVETSHPAPSGRAVEGRVGSEEVKAEGGTGAMQSPALLCCPPQVPYLHRPLPCLQITCYMTHSPPESHPWAPDPQRSCLGLSSMPIKLYEMCCMKPTPHAVTGARWHHSASSIWARRVVQGATMLLGLQRKSR